ncbi:unnamed protein product [Effrenium voratum]|nr:unnamed protein product [Effrenium voratum]
MPARLAHRSTRPVRDDLISTDDLLARRETPWGFGHRAELPEAACERGHAKGVAPAEKRGKRRAEAGEHGKYLLAAQQSLQKQAAACAGRLSDAKAEATVKAGEELVSALQLEGRRLQLQADGAQRKERRSGELAALYEGQARAAEAYIKSLKGCGQNLEPQLKADAQALQDAELVFAGESPAPRVLRGAKNLSPVESAALAMGVAVD